MSGMMNTKTPPGWSPEGDKKYPFRDWLQDVELWLGATEVDPIKQGPALAMRIGGVAREIIRELDLTVLSQGRVIPDQYNQPMQQTGVQYLVAALSRRYMPLPQELQVHAIGNIFLQARPGVH